MRAPPDRTARPPARTLAATPDRRDPQPCRPPTAGHSRSLTPDLDRDLAARMAARQVSESFRDSVEVVSFLDHGLHLSRLKKAAQQDEVVLFQAGDEDG